MTRWTPRKQLRSVSRSVIEPTWVVQLDSRRSSPTTSCRRARSVRTRPSPRCPALPVTSTRIGVRSRPDCQLRGLHLERFEFSAASVLVRGRDTEANDPDCCFLGDDPFGHPEFALGLRSRRAIPHRDVHDLAADIEVDDQLRRFLALAGGWISDEHTEANGLAALAPVPKDAVLRMTGRLEQSEVAVDDQSSLSGRWQRGRRLRCRAGTSLIP